MHCFISWICRYQFNQHGCIGYTCWKHPCQPLFGDVSLPLMFHHVAVTWMTLLYVRSLGDPPFPSIFSSNSHASSISSSWQSPLIIKDFSCSCKFPIITQTLNQDVVINHNIMAQPSISWNNAIASVIYLWLSLSSPFHYQPHSSKNIYPEDCVDVLVYHRISFPRPVIHCTLSEQWCIRLLF